MDFEEWWKKEKLYGEPGLKEMFLMCWRAGYDQAAEHYYKLQQLEPLDRSL